MPSYQIEMLWACTICKFADNRGLHKHCNQCGKPKESRDAERFPDDISENNALEGEDARKASAGPDWQCEYCKTLQNSLGRCCAECGADKSLPRRSSRPCRPSHGSRRPRKVPRPNPRKARIDIDPFRSTAVEAKKAIDDLSKNIRFSPEPVGYREPAVQEVPAVEFVLDTGGYRTPPKVRVVPVPWLMPGWVPKLAGSVAIAAILFLALWLIFRTKIVDAHVESVSWQHDVVIDRYQVYRREGWDSDNGAFEVHDEGRRVHHYDHVQVGSHQESYTCGENCTTVRGACRTTPRSCTSNKNGTANCSGGDRVCDPDMRSCTPKTCTRTAHRTIADYEDQPRYRTWYSWKVWDWGHDRTIRASGASLDTRWPSEAELEPKRPLVDREQERSRREESYTVVFSDRKDQWTIRPKSESEFQRFSPGSRFKLKVGLANGVTVLGPNGGSTDY